MGREAALLTCPFCDSPDIEHVAQWGGQMITRQVRCRACNTYFEVVRDDFSAREDGEGYPTVAVAAASASRSL